MDDNDYYDYTDGDDRWRPSTGLLVALGALVWFGGIAFVLLNGRVDESTTRIAAESTISSPSPVDGGLAGSSSDANTAQPAVDSRNEIGGSEQTTSATRDAANGSTGGPTANTTAPEPTQSRSAPAATAGPSYPVLPDGTPKPIVGILDTDSITLTGFIHSEAASERLEDLAVAVSKFPDATLINLMTVDPTVPQSVGVRVIELNSVRFPESSAQILPEHASELDRAVGILDLFPNVSVDVIGHADQRGDAQANFELSESRARAVTGYLVENGIAPERLSARAVGSEDLLSDDTSNDALALNRRTEFIFYGLLLDPVTE